MLDVVRYTSFDCSAPDSASALDASFAAAAALSTPATSYTAATWSLSQLSYGGFEFAGLLLPPTTGAYYVSLLFWGFAVSQLQLVCFVLCVVCCVFEEPASRA